MFRININKKKSTVKGRWTKNLMFSQRNNPYCDLLKISDAKIIFFLDIAKSFSGKLYFCGRNINTNNYEKDSWP